MRFRSLTRIAVAAVIVETASCRWDCGAGSTREVTSFATIAAVGDTFHVDGYASAVEDRGGSNGPSQQLIVGVQATDPASIGIPVPAALRGHVTYVSLLDASGTTIYRAALPNVTDNEPSLIGFVATSTLSPDEFEKIREMLLANQISIHIETDLPSIQLGIARLAVRQSYGWSTPSCP